METVQSSAIRNPIRTSVRPDNDNRPRLDEPALSMGRSLFPDGATARIYQPCRSAMTSAKPRKDWRLVFEPRTAPFVEPLMGYTGGRDTLTQVQLDFPTLEAAIRYAERQGLNFVVQAAPPASQATVRSQDVSEKQALSDVVWQRLQLAWLQASHGYGAGVQAAHIQTVLSAPEAFYTSAMEVVDDPVLSPDEKRAVLKNSAWNEYLIDLATAEGMPENTRPTRLDEVELALLALSARNGGFQTRTSPVHSRIAA
ncbi:ETC complex I subunit [Mesorhizobium sp. B292B1B]|uniref:NADH dehydrogenase ubiquinone Fe-S protein 4 n=1 Tax=unclassified Mesorhizobium TaxID=325217 RepID=UPI0011281E06|nr:MULTISPECIES: NADH dehydrogenase ubiquinone Fe-S protein 4 [unclassified Mesorhizobium]MCA0011825.1 ETC complex I subunit [Mesorhizobium sp. B294B1A1]MCA0038079.1 ETC complex I subunit [Mesorhizobium sp. B292B1B]TPM42631.1 ETC complex I subunit [Mesorhizobium sp. B2-3-2]